MNNLLIVLLTILSSSSFAQLSGPPAEERPKPPHLPKEEKEGSPCWGTEHMPYPCICEDREAWDKGGCRDSFMVNEIYTNLTYPDSSRILNHEGMVVITFVIDENGQLGDIAVARGIDKWIDAESLRVATSMVENHCWIAGERCRCPIPIRFNIPIRWKLR